MSEEVRGVVNVFDGWAVPPGQRALHFERSRGYEQALCGVEMPRSSDHMGTFWSRKDRTTKNRPYCAKCRKLLAALLT